MRGVLGAGVGRLGVDEQRDLVQLVAGEGGRHDRETGRQRKGVNKRGWAGIARHSGWRVEYRGEEEGSEGDGATRHGAAGGPCKGRQRATGIARRG